jgi:hypothetical protein
MVAAVVGSQVRIQEIILGKSTGLEWYPDVLAAMNQNKGGKSVLDPSPL